MFIGRVARMSSISVDISSARVKFTSPPMPSVPCTVNRPMRWFKGARPMPIIGTFGPAPFHAATTARSGNIAPLGVPVLPDEWIIAVRRSEPSLWVGISSHSCGLPSSTNSSSDIVATRGHLSASASFAASHAVLLALSPSS